MIPVNVATLLRKGGVEFGVLGEEEACCGNEIRRIGEAGLFEELQEENIAAFKEYGVREIIALSPHCMNALKKEYGELGIKVSHYTEVLADLIAAGSLKIEGRYEKKVIYHDPCFLGKQNGIFDQPRSILRSLAVLSFSNLPDRGRPPCAVREGAAGCSSRRRGRRARGTRKSGCSNQWKKAPR